MLAGFQVVGCPPLKKAEGAGVGVATAKYVMARANALFGETATLAVDRMLGNSFATPKVQCDCLKIGLDFVSTDLQAVLPVARHFGCLERMA